jgi:enoyl-CoA hydratase/carnithine racemase
MPTLARFTFAEGDNFCAGADVLSNFVGKDSNFGRRMIAKAFAITHKLERLPPDCRCSVRNLPWWRM